MNLTSCQVRKKNPDSKDCIIYVMFWGRQNCRDRKQITRSEGPKEILGFGQVKKQSLIVCLHSTYTF